MPAAAVIPAPVAYTDVAAVKKLVVDCRVDGAAGKGTRLGVHPAGPRVVRGWLRVCGAHRVGNGLGVQDGALSCGILPLQLLGPHAPRSCPSTRQTRNWVPLQLPSLGGGVAACSRTECVLAVNTPAFVVLSHGGGVWRMSVAVTVNKTACSRQATGCQYAGAWHNKESSNGCPFTRALPIYLVTLCVYTFS